MHIDIYICIYIHIICTYYIYTLISMVSVSGVGFRVKGFYQNKRPVISVSGSVGSVRSR